MRPFAGTLLALLVKSFGVAMGLTHRKSAFTGKPICAKRHSTSLKDFKTCKYKAQP